MAFLIDNALSPQLAELMRDHGFDAVHLRDKLPVSSDDQAVFELAAREGRTIISADTDFGVILANRQDVKPSFILLRHDAPGLPEHQWPLLSKVHR